MEASMQRIPSVTPALEIRRMVEGIARELASPRGSLEDSRAAMDARGASVPLPSGVRHEPARLQGELTGEWVLPPAPGARVVLYLHGGAFCVGSAVSHRPLSAQIAAHGRCRVLAVNYRLGPEHRYPAALDDAVASYRWLLERGHRASDVVVAGDSAGGGLAMALLLRSLRDGADRLPMPGGAVGLSPWLDLECSSASYERHAAADPLANGDGLRFLGRGYVAGHDITDPLASPFHAKDLTGLCPLLLQVGSVETLYDEVTDFGRRAEQAGAAVTLQVWENMPHVWHAMIGALPEADRALGEVGRWLDVGEGVERS